MAQCKKTSQRDMNSEKARTSVVRSLNGVGLGKGQAAGLAVDVVLGAADGVEVALLVDEGVHTLVCLRPECAGKQVSCCNSPLHKRRSTHPQR